MKYKAIICDLDGTLLNPEHRISEKSKEIIKKVRELGVKVFIATGRHYLDAKIFKDQLGLESYLISSNGSRIHNETEQVIYSQNIEYPLYQEVLKYTKVGDITRHIYTDIKWYLEEASDEYDAFYEETGFSYDVTDFDKFDEKEIIKLFFMSKNTDYLLEVEEKLEENLKDKIEITLSSAECLEVMKKDVSKGKAIKKVMKDLGIELDEIIAFGDGMNDYEMLSIVGKGLLMGNCSDRLKEALPNNEIIGANSEDGVALYLEKIFDL